MLILRCTKKLLKKLDVPDDRLASEDVVSISPLGNWHANVIGVSRYHGVIFVNDATLFSFVVFNTPLATLKNELSAVFNNAFCNALLSEGFATEWIQKAEEVGSTFKIGRSTNRRVLGNINDLIMHYQFALLRHGGVTKCDLSKTICKMNRIPQKNIGWSYSIEAMKKLAGEPFREGEFLQ